MMTLRCHSNPNKLGSELVYSVTSSCYCILREVMNSSSPLMTIRFVMSQAHCAAVEINTLRRPAAERLASSPNANGESQLLMALKQNPCPSR